MESQRVKGQTGRCVAVFAIVVEAKDEQAAAFYGAFGFLPFPDRPLRLFIPVADAMEAMLRAQSGQMAGDKT